MLSVICPICFVSCRITFSLNAAREVPPPGPVGASLRGKPPSLPLPASLKRSEIRLLPPCPPCPCSRPGGEGALCGHPPVLPHAEPQPAWLKHLSAASAPLPPAADQTVKVWDVATQQCRHTLSHHTGKVQAVSWNPAEASVLLTGAFDKQACLVSWGGGAYVLCIGYVQL